jgi:multiple sugar transport system ATP-binding protein
LHDRLKITTIYVTHDQTEALTLADRVAVLRDGVIEQIGTPRELYETPANVFVAGFIGQPPMNMIEARIHRGIAETVAFRVPLPADWPHSADGRALTVGIRPEHVRVSGAPRKVEPGTSAVGTVRLIERSGGHPWVSIELASAGTDGLVVATMEAGQEVRIGDTVTISIRQAVVHFFNPVTGERIGGRRLGAEVKSTYL